MQKQWLLLEFRIGSPNSICSKIEKDVIFIPSEILESTEIITKLLLNKNTEENIKLYKISILQSDGQLKDITKEMPEVEEILSQENYKRWEKREDHYNRTNRHMEG